jgi:hypothetical protein
MSQKTPTGHLETPTTSASIKKKVSAKRRLSEMNKIDDGAAQPTIEKRMEEMTTKVKEVSKTTSQWNQN